MDITKTPEYKEAMYRVLSSLSDRALNLWIELTPNLPENKWAIEVQANRKK